MFGIGMPEMILILAVALIVIGPKKLPDLAKSLGKAMGEFKKATSELKESMQIDTELDDVKSTFQEIEKDIRTTTKPDTAKADKKSVDAALSGDTPAPHTSGDDDVAPGQPLAAAKERRESEALNSDPETHADDGVSASSSGADSKANKG